MEVKAFQDITLSRLGMGNMRLPTLNGDPNAVDEVQAQEIIDYGMSHGINYYDTAYVYMAGNSERFLGRAMKKYPRDSYYLATKFNIRANPDYKAVFEEQLLRLQTDHIDFYLIHALGDSTCQSYLDCGCIEYFLEQKRLGRIRYLGFSAHASVDTLRRFADHHAWDFAQLQINYFDWLYGTSKAEYQVLAERNIPTMVMEPVRGGRLAALTTETETELKKAHPDWSMASWALRWVRRLPNVQVILSGMSNPAQMRDNVRTFEDLQPLSDEDEQLLLEVCRRFHSQVVVPCTACRYCCDDCPMGINIPEYLKVYTAAKVQGQWAAKELAAKIDSQGRPSDCIGCGCCTGHCPQNIDVPSFMEKLTDILIQLGADAK